MQRNAHSYSERPNAAYWLNILFMLICVFCFSSCDHLKDNDTEEIDPDVANSAYPTKEQLDKKYAKEWNKPEYQKAHTAKQATYLTAEEKEVYYYLNLARINPPLFARTYATGYEGDHGWGRGYAWDERKKSLIKTLSDMKAVGLMEPDEALFEIARCFAYESGRLGITGHDRSLTGCSNGWHAECCHYGGVKNGLSIVMSFLIDAGESNAALMHRAILLDSRYDRMGVSIQPHSKYQLNAVLDFKRKQ